MSNINVEQMSKASIEHTKPVSCQSLEEQECHCRSRKVVSKCGERSDA